MKYNIILADPPWTFKTYSDKGKQEKSPEAHYSCMVIDDIYELPVQKIAADNCILFIWVTWPLLQEGLETIRRWGFQYKTCAFNWVKQNKKAASWFWGLGYWTRSNSEVCLLATRGMPGRTSRSVHQICDAKIMQHSRKPDEIRDRIVQLCGDLPRIELFACRPAEGWTSVGNMIDGKDIKEALNEIIPA